MRWAWRPWRPWRPWRAWRAALLLCAVVGCSVPGASALAPAQASDAGSVMQLLHAERSLYRQVLIYQQGGTRCLCFTRLCTIGRQSCMDVAQPDRLVFDYTRMMLGALLLGPPPQDILIIGLGGGTLPRALTHLLPQAQLDLVEIDPAVVQVASDYFAFRSDEHLHVHVEDGRTYVRHALRAGRQYDLIMLDAYDHQYIPEHMLTAEFLQEVHGLLRSGAVLAANTFSSSRLYDNESVTYRRVFGEFFNLRSANRVILTRLGGLPALDSVRANAARWAGEFRLLGFDPADLVGLYSRRVDWNTQARVLTDQYSPANLLNAR